MKLTRPPIVTVLGHVDHGKTTLLDAVRESHLAEREAGGITQGIGASQIETDGGKITFLDTPGHEAFSDMRERGVKVADIAVLVVAADDGVMPQTKEAISYIKNAKIPFIVAFTKTDLPSAQVEQARSQLEQEEVYFEGRGGDTPEVRVSAKKKEGIKDLIEMIQLVAEVNEVSGDPERELDAVVIEANKDKRGNVVSAVVRNGSLKVGENISAGDKSAKVRGLFDQFNKPTKAVFPGDPVAVLGFSELVEVGTKIVDGETSGKSQQSEETSKEQKKVGDKEIGIILKVANAGSMDALKHSLPNGIVTLREDVGDITENDIFFAKAANAQIISFESKLPNNAKRLAENEGVEVHTFKIIYELIDYLKDALDEKTVKISGKADILATFPYNKQLVAGCKISEGMLTKSDKVQIMRGEKLIGDAKIVSMRREKASIDSAKSGEECGIIVLPSIAFEQGDVIIAVKK